MALEFIDLHEQLGSVVIFGIFGSCLPRSNKFYVNLRCMSIQDYMATVYVGGGITEKSDPQNEWKEVLQKANTMGRILASEQ